MDNNPTTTPTKTTGEITTSVRVCVRVRPADVGGATGSEMIGHSCVRTDAATPAVIHLTVPTENGRKTETHSMNFTHVFGESATQGQVYEKAGVGEMVEAATSGFACTIMCYGQTGSGKTYTMTGPPHPVNNNNINHDDEGGGLLQRSIQHVFEMHDLVFKKLNITLSVSYYEIYNEKVNDLIIIDGPAHTNLNVRWNTSSQSFFVEGLIVVKCDTLGDVMAVLQEGLQNRRRAAHALNEDSSRSHTIFTMYFESPTYTGKLNFVDLAGSERFTSSASSTTTTTTATPAETRNINRSLFTLGKVISTLSEVNNNNHNNHNHNGNNNHSSHIPYRDSTLTRLLMDSLGGNCRTLMIATINPQSRWSDESLQTLKYAIRMGKVVTTATTTTTATTAASGGGGFGAIAIRRTMRGTNEDVLKEEIERLKRENAQLKFFSSSSALDSAPTTTTTASGVVPYETHLALQQKYDALLKSSRADSEKKDKEILRLRKQMYSNEHSSSDQQQQQSKSVITDVAQQRRDRLHSIVQECVDDVLPAKTRIKRISSSNNNNQSTAVNNNNNNIVVMGIVTPQGVLVPPSATASTTTVPSSANPDDTNNNNNNNNNNN
eukprot:PhM_4_TR9263/c1_g1_i2/m.104900